jgi:hypothetical protein
MTYRKAVALAVLTFIGTIAYDAWFITNGNFGKDGYLPGLYPLACALVLGGLYVAKKHGIWDSKLQPAKAETIVRVMAVDNILRAGPTPLGISKLAVPVGMRGTLREPMEHGVCNLVQWDNGEIAAVHPSDYEVL